MADNSFTETRTVSVAKPEWDGFARIVSHVPGYDCRVVCRHTRHGEHGLYGDELLFVLARGDAALSLRVATSLLYGHADAELAELYARLARVPAPYIRGHDLSLHTGFPTDEDQVRCVIPDTCPWLGAPCYMAYSSIIDAGELVDESPLLGHSIYAAAELPDERAFLPQLGSDDLWEGLRVRFAELYQVARSRAAQLPHRCAHCYGKGLVPRGAS